MIVEENSRTLRKKGHVKVMEFLHGYISRTILLRSLEKGNC